MKRLLLGIVCFLLTGFLYAQKAEKGTAHTLLWKISGNGLKQPSYLFGTIHMICASDAFLSDNLKKAIQESEDVYLEIDLDDMAGMLDSFSGMKMKNDTTFADLMSELEYEKVKNYFEKNSFLMPFSMIESLKPFLAASTMTQNNFPCAETVSMDQLIMMQAYESKKEIKGLETIADQLAVFDKIPYKVQADLLVQYVDSLLLGKDNKQEYEELIKAYKDQNLTRFNELTQKVELGVSDYTDLILHQRNRNWVEKLKSLLPEKSMVIAVGAGHLPGKTGLIELLKKAGFTLTPLENKAKVKVI